MTVPFPSQISTRHTSLALSAIEDAGLQVPAEPKLELIVRCAYSVAAHLWFGALLTPSHSELDEVFQDFVVRCVNKAPGVGDVLS
jgi:hypothetical protein